MLVLSAWSWHKALPVAPSDTVNQFGDDGAVKRSSPTALHNRTGSAILAHLVHQQRNATTRVLETRSVVVAVPAYGAFIMSDRLVRVNATGTTNGATSALAYERILVSQVGAAFTNQPANDGVEIVSNNAADTTQTATVYGTTTATDTLVRETVALNGTSVVSTVKIDWGQVLGVVLSASCAGTVTFREASGDATITTITTGNLSKGVETIPTASSYPTPKPTVVASGATTKQIGLYGTTLAGAAGGDSQALTGTTAVAMNAAFGSETLLLTGDVENTVTVTVSVSADLLAVY